MTTCVTVYGNVAMCKCVTVGDLPSVYMCTPMGVWAGVLHTLCACVCPRGSLHLCVAVYVTGACDSMYMCTCVCMSPGTCVGLLVCLLVRSHTLVAAEWWWNLPVAEGYF